MTERKPPGLSFESWVDRQIREAEQRGDFAHLPGAGKPLPNLNAPYDELWWIKQKMAQEGSAAILHPTLALRKEIEDVLAKAARAPYERRVRELLEPVNEKIAANLRTPPPGPPLGRPLIDIDEAVAEWRQAHDKGTGDDTGDSEKGRDSEDGDRPRRRRLRIPRLRRHG
ncbi:DUF1992 domain-containing protein [Streptomyces sp. NBC_01306]|uniref:DnaJ family domain-containing protein n=1 Tax=Streptomyces sp. NBC_01306 TaxID=2903819 RepID=UPI0022561D77|nr:DUF1992 domain-containing protein [Streptomyces sp. NBC_01306]MCX4725936.1 DUF1992 domain-containing protein [Streptomyces sp. NBC_01306]